MNIDHIWFDVGGTLYRETPEFTAAHDAFRYNLYAQITGTRDISKIKADYDELYRKHGSNSAVFASIGKAEDFWQESLENMDMRAVLQPDLAVPNTLKVLSKSYDLSIFSNFKLAKILELLDYLKIDKNLFTYILDGDQITKRKPNTEGFYKIIAIEQCEPSKILYVGDREAVDVVPARAVGMKTALVYGHGVQADISVSNFADLSERLL